MPVARRGTMANGGRDKTGKWERERGQGRENPGQEGLFRQGDKNTKKERRGKKK